jgi:hypothetical protein
LQDGKLYMGTPANASCAAANAPSLAADRSAEAPYVDLTSWYSICSVSGTPAGALGAEPAHRPFSARGAPCESIANRKTTIRKQAGQQQSGKQQHADSDKASSRPAARNAQQQQNQGAGRSQQGSGDGAAPRVGSRRDADNPSLSANQEDRRGQQAPRDSVESLQGEQGGGNDENNSRQR